MSSSDTLWYKDAIIYQLHVKAFCDSSEDGFGDFQGLAQKLDYIKQLGVTAIWLLPFYPSPLKDDGYDIADYAKIHPHYGTLRDFRAFVHRAHELGLRVITELVINHTSDQHPWFQAARRAPAGSVKRDFYVWSESDRKFPETRIIFTDTESSNWAWDPVAKAYYWHRFFSHQPDLNHNNPRVVKAVMRVMRHWLDVGVDGLRLDAIPYLCVREGTNNENLPETHQVIKQLRAELDAHYQDRMLLAEANQWPEDVRHYFGEGDECHMAFHFPVMPRIYMAVAQEDREPIIDIMEQTPEIPAICQWGLFLRNHDELTLEMVTDRERDYMYRVYATDPNMRRNVGICRRLAPLMDNDRTKIELLNSLLLSFPGTPIIYYGDEIGMGDNIYLGDRNGVRTPMQWSMDRNAGFSRVDPARLYLPVIMGPVYGYQAVNAEAQHQNPSSLLNWMRRIIAVRKEHRAFGRGSLRFLHPRNRRVLAYLREHEDETLLCVANLAHSPQPVELDLREFRGRVPVELLGWTPFPRINEWPYMLSLPGHGFYWFRIASPGETSLEEVAAPLQIPFWVVPQGWSTVLEGEQHLGQTLLPRFLRLQRWFGGKQATIERMQLNLSATSDFGSQSLLCVGRVQLAGREEQDYLLPLSLTWDDAGYQLLGRHPSAVVAKVRQGFRCGVLHDALLDPAFCLMLANAVAENRVLALAGGELRCRSISPLPLLDERRSRSVRVLGTEQTHTSVVLGEQLVLKCYRQLNGGPSTELEMGRFLTEVARFPNTPPIAGYIEYVQPGAPAITVGLLQGFVANLGDGWSYTMRHLEPYFDQQLAALERQSAPDAKEATNGLLTPTGVVADAASGGSDGLAAYLAFVRTLGLRTAQLHTALSLETGDPAFDPEPINAEDLTHWRELVRGDTSRALTALAAERGGLPAQLQADIDRLLSCGLTLQQRIGELALQPGTGKKIRVHGNYHLGQALVAGHDVQIIDFEGEHTRAHAPRRNLHKWNPLRDVAGMICSFNYAVSAALLRVAAGRAERLMLLEAAAQKWSRLASSSFLAGYEEGARGSIDESSAALIELFMLERALCEIDYDLNHRPDWVSIPLRSIRALLPSD